MGRDSAPRSSRRCPRSPSARARSTSARASRTRTAPPRCSRPRERAIRDGHNQYAPLPGVPGAARGDRRPPGALLRDRGRPGRRRCRSRSAPRRRSRPRCSACASRATRWSASSPTTTPTRRGSRWRARSRRPVTLRPPDWAFDPDALAAAITPRARGAAAQHAAQPDRQGVLARGAGAGRRRLHRARPDRGHRRGLRAPRVRRRARPARDAARDGRADADDLLARQDVLGHGLEDRLGGRAAPSWWRRRARPSST